MNAELKVNIDELVKDVVEVALAEALTKKSPDIIRELVRSALYEKSGQYSRDTVLQAALKTAIVALARQQMGRWIEEHLEEIRAIVDHVIRKEFTPESVATNVLQDLRNIKQRLSPFSTMEKADDSEDE